MLLIGSSAIKHHFPDFPREPKDLDYAVADRMQSAQSTVGIEYLYNPIIGHLEGVATPDMLYTLKISHAIGWDINWDKHVFDIQFLKEKGAVVDMRLFNDLYAFWQEYNVNKRSNLNMSAESFFNNVVKCPHDHDYLHTMLNPVPTFTKVLKDGAEVDVCDEKFNRLTFEEKLDLVREEVMVMAYERYPNLNHLAAYSRMLKKFVINHAPIWEAIFILENFKHLHKAPYNYVKKIEDGLSTASTTGTESIRSTY